MIAVAVSVAVKEDWAALRKCASWLWPGLLLAHPERFELPTF